MEADIQTWVRLLRAQKILLERVEAALKAAGLPPLSWYDVLLELDREDSRAGLRQFEIAGRVLLNKHNLTRLLDRLEDKGLVARSECPEDGRGNLVTITRKGQALRRKMWPVYAGAIRENFGDRLGEREISALSRALGKLID